MVKPVKKVSRRAPPAATARPGRLPAGRVRGLAGLAPYAAGGIVSRTLVGNRAGTVTLFAFDAGQGLSEHTAPYDALIQVLEGRGEFTLAGRARSVKAGEVLLLPARVPHAVKAPRRFKMLLTMLRAPDGS